MGAGQLSPGDGMHGLASFFRISVEEPNRTAIPCFPASSVAS
jgi:hypothetical protein